MLCRQPLNAIHISFTGMTQTEQTANKADSKHYEVLTQRYPLFFRAAHYPTTHPCTLSAHGIQCGLGWHRLIDEMSSSIEEELRTVLATIYESHKLISVERRLQKLPRNGQPGDDDPTDPSALIPFCSDISTRNELLDITVTSGYIECGEAWVRIRKIVDAARVRSSMICEVCGYEERQLNYHGCYMCQLRSSLSEAAVTLPKSRRIRK